MERQVSTTAIAGTVFSLAFSLLCILLANPLLRLLQVPAEILPIAVNYLRIVFAGLLFTFFYNFLAATLRALGDSKSALYFLMISAVLNIGGDFAVKSFREKSQLDSAPINAGYMVLEPAIFDYLTEDGCIFEQEPMRRLAAEGQLMSYQHQGFWQCMDTLFEKTELEQLWESGRAPWKVW